MGVSSGDPPRGGRAPVAPARVPLAPTPRPPAARAPLAPTPRPPSVAPARPPSSPPAARPPSSPPPARVPRDPREEKEAIAELTRTLVQSMNRTSYYEPGHPAYATVRGELHQLLMSVLREEPQVGFVLHRADPPEIFVDGLHQGRVKLAQVLEAGSYDLFVPRFIEYFDRHDLVLLAFRQGIGEDELGRAVMLLSRPSDRRGDLSAELLAARCAHVSALCSSEIARDPDLPWQVRVCFARLRRDLRIVPMFRHLGHDALRRAKRQLVADTVRPLQSAELVRQLVFCAPRVEREVANIEGLEDLSLTDAIVEELAPRPLVELTRMLCDELAAATPAARAADVEHRLSRALALCARRISKDDSRETEPVLRELVARGALAIEDVPEDLGEWLEAEALHARGEPGTARRAPIATPRDVRVLGKLGRLAASSGDRDEVLEVADRLVERVEARDAEAREALSAVLDDAALAALVEDVERASPEVARAAARRLVAVGPRGAGALVAHVVTAGDRARAERVFRLLGQLRGRAAPAIARALGRDRLAAPALRLLLSLGAGPAACRETAEAAARHVAHADPTVRAGALAAVLAGELDRAADVLEAALDDRDPAVVGVAITGLVERLGRPAAARRRALTALSRASADAPAELLLPAVRAVERHPGEGDERARAIEALRAAHAALRGHTGFLGIGWRPAARPEVVAAVERALAALGAPVDARA